MIYLTRFSLPALSQREQFINDQRRICCSAYFDFFRAHQAEFDTHQNSS